MLESLWKFYQTGLRIRGYLVQQRIILSRYAIDFQPLTGKAQQVFPSLWYLRTDTLSS
jgi:hypothetical protein